ncbi:hypothetical protein JZ751_027688 [Albula glossodonta]|uniref:Uncharacterized protein n=1 Tax=Albula glossodonta TaxID=121402 RepID=A0A8T2P9N4_9TELE|nr:hypothetical protein JZ751_027688 [Albula glossodonta]
MVSPYGPDITVYSQCKALADAIKRSRIISKRAVPPSAITSTPAVRGRVGKGCGGVGGLGLGRGKRGGGQGSEQAPATSREARRRSGAEDSQTQGSYHKDDRPFLSYGLQHGDPEWNRGSSYRHLVPDMIQAQELPHPSGSTAYRRNHIKPRIYTFNFLIPLKQSKNQ